MATVNYTPPPSLVPFFVSEQFISLVVGPIGCVSAETEFLTPTGWKRIDSYKDGDLVAQWNADTERAEFVRPLEYIKKPCDKFYHFHHNYGLSQVLSAEHRVVYRLRRKQPTLHERTAEEIAQWHWRNGADMVRIPVTFNAPETEGMPYTDDELRLGVAVCADGTLSKTPGAVIVNIKKGYKKERLVQLLERTGTKYSIQKGPTPEFTRYYFHPKLTDKVFDAKWWNCNAHQLAVIAEELPKWDGCLNSKGLKVFNTKIKASADFAQYAFVTSGLKTSLVEAETSNGKYWRVVASSRGAKHVGLAGVRKDRTQSNNCRVVPSPDGFKYCFRVPSTYLVLRHNNCVFVTGNSTKTSAAIMKIAYHAKRMAPCQDGIRRSRCCWVRNTNEQLKDTSIPDFMKWFPDGVAGSWKATEKKFMLKFDDVECEVLFRGLDDKNDVRRLLSLQLSFAVLDEFREIDEEIFKTLQGRLGRYPDKSMVVPRKEWGNDLKGNPIGGCVTDDGTSNAHLWACSNPPDLDTFWERMLTTPPKNCHVSIQPDALTDEADWLKYLPENYYENLCEGKDEDWVDVYVRNKFGKSLAGKPVFRSFSKPLHVTRGLNPIYTSANPLIIGMDVALHPAATLGQVDATGRLLVFQSVSAEGMGALRFVREVLKPALAKRFAGMEYLVVVDPAANTRAQTDERTVLEVLEAEGFNVVTAPTNALQPRISAVDSYLTRMVDGKPSIVFDEDGCEDLIQTMLSKYRYRMRKTGEIDDKPEKLHPWSDLADSLQYLCLQTDATGVFNTTKRSVAPPIRHVGWCYA